MVIDKEKAMLIDVQYIRPKRGEHTDFIYLVWKDIDTGEKHLEKIPDPTMTIYFEKPEFRNHRYNKTYIKKEEAESYEVEYKKITQMIARDMGDAGQAILDDMFKTGNYGRKNEFYLHPYTFGSDYDIKTFYRHKWLTELDNDRVKPITKGFLDIEVDTLESVGLPSPSMHPIDLVTIIDASSRISYTFCLVGVECQEKDISRMTSNKEKQHELKRREMYKHRIDEQNHYLNNKEEMIKAAHDMFDENYPDMDYKVYFYKDELTMINHIWQLINTLKLDFMQIWNMPFDIPYFYNRIIALGGDPTSIMCHPDFPVKQCFFHKDEHHFAVKEKNDYFELSSYTVFMDQMRNYAAIRKGSSELRSNKLTFIAQKEIKDAKLDYSEQGNIKTLSYNNWLLYFLYNIKDVLLQMGIEEKTSDIDTIYLYSYSNITDYKDIFKQTVKLRNVQYKSFLAQGLIPGNNVNSILFNEAKYAKEANDEDDDDDDEPTFEGALVGDPTLISDFGDYLYGKRTNSIFKYSIDFDMSAFYPSTIRAMNIDPSTLIFKMKCPADQFEIRGGELKYKGITDIPLNKHNNDSFVDDISKEIMDNFQTQNYLEFGYKWLGLPSVTKMYNYIKERI